MKLIDAMGVEHTRLAADAQPRIVSLVPSVTELLCDLGLAERIVGRTGFCIHPANTVRAIAKVGGTKDVNIEKIRKLAPTHLVVNIDENEKPTVDALARVLYCIWQDPWMTVARDTYIARMLALAGMAQWAAPDNVSRYPVFTWSDALAGEIDEVLLSSEPYRFTEAHVDAIERQTGKPARLVDGEMMSWYGSRGIAGLRYLREL